MANERDTLKRLKWKNAEQLVCKKLWQYGYRAKQMGQTHSFDILVEDTVRLEVKSASPDSKNYWTFQRTFFDKADVFALVFYAGVNSQRKPLILFITSDRLQAQKLSNGPLRVKKETIEDLKGDTSPLKVIQKKDRVSKLIN